MVGPLFKFGPTRDTAAAGSSINRISTIPVLILFFKVNINTESAFITFTRLSGADTYDRSDRLNNAADINAVRLTAARVRHLYLV